MAPPGAEPHIAAVPGSTSKRASSQPSPLLAATTEKTPAANSGQSFNISLNRDGARLRATMQPMIACATTKAGWGMRNDPSAMATRIAAAIGPSSRAAGSRSISRTMTKGTEITMRAAH